MNELLEGCQCRNRRFGAVDEQFRGEVTLILQPEHMLEALQVLRDEFQL